jgi:hypothetical protein
MQDPVLERQLSETRELQTLWQQFFDFFKRGVAGGDDMTPERDAEFLEVKSQIATYHDVFASALRKQEQRQTGQAIMTIVGRCITLRHINLLTDVDIKKLNLEWHECYLLLNETVADLEEKVERLAAISPFSFYFNRYRRRTWAAITNFFKSAGFKLAIGIAVIAAVITVWNLFDLGSQVQKVGFLRPIYYIGVDAYRTFIDSNYPYDSIDRVLAQRRGFPPGWEDLTSASGSRGRLEGMMGNTFGGDTTELLKGAKDYRGFQMRYLPSSGPGGGTMDIHVWLLPSTYQGQQIADQFRQWKVGAPAEEVQKVGRDMKLLRWLNAIIVFHQGTEIMRDRAADEIFSRAQKP